MIYFYEPFYTLSMSFINYLHSSNCFNAFTVPNETPNCTDSIPLLANCYTSQFWHNWLCYSLSNQKRTFSTNFRLFFLYILQVFARTRWHMELWIEQQLTIITIKCQTCEINSDFRNVHYPNWFHRESKLRPHRLAFGPNRWVTELLKFPLILDTLNNIWKIW